MKACDLGVAVAAAAVADPELGEPRPEAAGGEGGAVVASRARARPARSRASAAARSTTRDRFVGAAAQLELPGDDLAGAAVDDRDQVAPAVLGDPDAVMSSCHSCRGRSTRKKPGRFRRSSGRRRWISFRSRITRSTRLRLTATPSLRRTNAQSPSGSRRSGWPSASATIACSTGSAGGRRCGSRPRRRHPVERLAADPGDTRHHRGRVAFGDELTRAGDALSHSHSRNSFPAISSS